MNIYRHKGQHLAEYALILSLVFAAFIVMQTYVRRGLQGRYRDATDKVVSALKEATGDSSLPLQYEPYYTDSEITTTAEEDKVETVSLGGSKQTTIDSATERKGYEKILPAQGEQNE